MDQTGVKRDQNSQQSPVPPVHQSDVSPLNPNRPVPKPKIPPGTVRPGPPGIQKNDQSGSMPPRPTGQTNQPLRKPVPNKVPAPIINSGTRIGPAITVRKQNPGSAAPPQQGQKINQSGPKPMNTGGPRPMNPGPKPINQPISKPNQGPPPKPNPGSVQKQHRLGFKANFFIFSW